MIYLARHGQDEDNVNGLLNGHRDTPLTETGRAQAKAVAQNIVEHKLPIKRVFSSPLQRAYKTAEIISEALGLPEPEKLDLLIERDFGVMTGLPVSEIEARCAPDIIKSNPIVYFLSPEGAETFEVLLERARRVLEFLKEQAAEENVLLVTHGDIGKMIYAAYYDLPWKEVLLGFHFGNSEILLLDENSAPEERHIYKADQHNH